jgi:hypothetical protein
MLDEIRKLRRQIALLEQVANQDDVARIIAKYKKNIATLERKILKEEKKTKPAIPYANISELDQLDVLVDEYYGLLLVSNCRTDIDHEWFKTQVELYNDNKTVIRAMMTTPKRYWHHLPKANWLKREIENLKKKLA